MSFKNADLLSKSIISNSCKKMEKRLSSCIWTSRFPETWSLFVGKAFFRKLCASKNDAEPYRRNILGPNFQKHPLFQFKGPRFLEALNLWVRCRRRLFFSEKCHPDNMKPLTSGDVAAGAFFFLFRKMAPRFPDAAGGAGAGRTLRSQPDPSPNAPRDQIRRKDPCCD